MAMATDESLADDWVFLNEEDGEIKPSAESNQEAESVNDADEDINGEDLQISDDNQPDEEVKERSESPEEDPPVVLEDESDSFSVLSSFSDNFSYLSLYDNVMEDIIITAGKRCYAHFRNQKLNNSLDCLLAIAFTLVTGLAIGNFIGLSKNCEYEKYRLLQNCTVNNTDIFAALTPGSINKKIVEESRHMVSKMIEDNLSSRSNNFALMKVSVEKHSSNLKDKDLANEIIPYATQEEKHVYEITEALLSGSELNHNSFVNSDCNETNDDNNFFKSNEQSVFPSNIQSVQGKNVQNSNPMAMIQYLQGTVDEVMHRALQLTLNLPSEEMHSPDDSATIKHTRNVIQEFTDLVKETLDNLSKSVKSVDFKRNPSNSKSFFKTTSGILKSVDKLMKGVFEEAISKKEALHTRLHKIQNICFGVVKKLQKKLKKEEKKNFKPRYKYFKNDNSPLKNNPAQVESRIQKTNKENDNRFNDKNMKKKPYLRYHSN